MRAHEFVRKLTEADMHHYHHQAIPGAKTFPGMGQSYDMYRFSIAMAGAPNHEHPITDGTDATDNPATISYSQEDENKINAALKATGRNSAQVSGRGSFEPEDTHKVSPMLPFAGVKRKSSK
jgi:hypothetical protein